MRTIRPQCIIGTQRSDIACLKSMREDDTLIVWKLDRLGRNLRHLVNTIHELMERKIDFRVLTGQGANIDTTTAGGRWCSGYSPRWRNSSAS